MAANRLPPVLKQMYLALFHDAKSPEQICRENNISMEEFEVRKTTMLRSLMAAAGPARTADEPTSAAAS